MLVWNKKVSASVLLDHVRREFGIQEDGFGGEVVVSEASGEFS